jgi:hypothetical protein
MVFRAFLAAFFFNWIWMPFLAISGFQSGAFPPSALIWTSFLRSDRLRVHKWFIVVHSGGAGRDKGILQQKR